MVKALNPSGGGSSNVVEMAGFDALRRRHHSSERISRYGDLAREARMGFELQAKALAELAHRVDADYEHALDILRECRGRVVVCGIGKSGLVGRKLAATFASTGSPSLFLHPAEALHGDLGMLTQHDVVLFVCYSGETPEVTRLLPCFDALGVPSIALVGVMDSTLARAADVALDVSVEREVCPYNLAPTTSTLAALAMGDALAVSLMRARGFSERDFARFHPGGALGRRFLRVADVMQKDALPLVLPTTLVCDALFVMTQRRWGLAIVVDESEQLLGLVTDGDLRRALGKRPNLLATPVSEIMTPSPVTIHECAPVTQADECMQNLRLKALIVLNEEHRVSGVIEVFK
jgi:arabinose-5-phosphate isomerase